MGKAGTRGEILWSPLVRSLDSLEDVDVASLLLSPPIDVRFCAFFLLGESRDLGFDPRMVKEE